MLETFDNKTVAFSFKTTKKKQPAVSSVVCLGADAATLPAAQVESQASQAERIESELNAWLVVTCRSDMRLSFCAFETLRSASSRSKNSEPPPPPAVVLSAVAAD